MSKINVCIFTSRMLLLVACFCHNTGLEDFAKGGHMDRSDSMHSVQNTLSEM